MPDEAITATPLQATIPADDPGRTLTVTGPGDASVRHVSVVGDTYPILVSGAPTNGRYCLIDRLVPDGIRGISVGSAAMYRDLAAVLDRHAIRPVIGARFGFDLVREAYAAQASDLFGKVVVELA